MATQHAAAMRSLRGESGAVFDRAFLEPEVTYHRAVVDAVMTSLLPARQNQEVKDLVTKVVPACKAQMDAAQGKLDGLHD